MSQESSNVKKLSEYRGVNKESADLLADRLKDLPDSWVICRDVRHAWEVELDFSIADMKVVPHVIRRTLRCVRCETKRVETYLATKMWGLEKTASHYVYPDQYQIKGVPRGLKPQWLINAEQYRRAMARHVEIVREMGTE